jgi:hypothetical protein
MEEWRLVERKSEAGGVAGDLETKSRILGDRRA